MLVNSNLIAFSQFFFTFFSTSFFHRGVISAHYLLSWFVLRLSHPLSSCRLQAAQKARSQKCTSLQLRAYECENSLLSSILLLRVESLPGRRPGERPASSSGDDANAKVLLQLFQKDEGEHSVWNQADAGWDQTLEGGGWGGWGEGGEGYGRGLCTSAGKLAEKNLPLNSWHESR